MIVDNFLSTPLLSSLETTALKNWMRIHSLFTSFKSTTPQQENWLSTSQVDMRIPSGNNRVNNHDGSGWLASKARHRHNSRNEEKQPDLAEEAV